MEDLKSVEDKRCVACQGKLIRIYEDTYLRFDTPFQLIQDSLSMDVYECENCHRLDFYNASSDLPSEAKSEEMVICPECGKEHSVHINCPQCVAEKGFTSGFLSRGKEKVEKKEQRKKKNVPWEL